MTADAPYDPSAYEPFTVTVDLAVLTVLTVPALPCVL